MEKDFNLKKLNVLCLNYLLRKTSVQEELEIAERLKHDRPYRVWFNWLNERWLRTALIRRRYMTLIEIEN